MTDSITARSLILDLVDYIEGAYEGIVDEIHGTLSFEEMDREGYGLVVDLSDGSQAFMTITGDNDPSLMREFEEQLWDLLDGGSPALADRIYEARAHDTSDRVRITTHSSEVFWISIQIETANAGPFTTEHECSVCKHARGDHEMLEPGIWSCDEDGCTADLRGYCVAG